MLEDDDQSIGPAFKDEKKYTRSQLLMFSKHISRLQYNFPNEISKYKYDKDAQNKIRSVLFDSGLNRAQVLINSRIPSTKLLLRMFQRFLSCLEVHKVHADYHNWFLVEPDIPELQDPKPKHKTVVKIKSQEKPFDPDRQCSSKDC